MDLDDRHLGLAQNLIGVEIALLDPPILERDLAVERGGEAEYDGALHLHLDAARIDDMAAIDGADDPLDAQLALLADADLGDFADDRTEGLLGGHAAALALGPLL